MKPIVSKSLLLPLFAAALVLLNTSRAFGYVNQVWPDSVTMSTAVGTSTSTYVFVSDGRDTIPPNQPKGTIRVYLTGSSEFTLLSDSIVQFVGEAYIQLRYSPTSGSPTSATLVIVGDSNTLRVPILGHPTSHFPVGLLTSGAYDSLEANKQLCKSFAADNKNSQTIYVTAIILIDDQRPGTQWSLENVASLPFAVPPGTSNLGELCALVTSSDSDAQALTGSLYIVYTYSGGTDSTIVALHGQRQALNTNCISVSGTDFGAVVEGGSRTQSITLTNTTDTSIYVDSAQITGDYSEFTINSPSFPLVIAKGSSVSVSITFTVPSPSTRDNYSAKWDASIYGTSPDGMACNSLDVGLTGSLLIPVVDSVTLNVPPGSTALSITSHTTKSRHAIFIHNDSSAYLLIQSLALADSTTIAFFGSPGNLISYSYDSLHAGQTEGPIILTLETPDTGTYNLNLILTYIVQGTQSRKQITGNSTYEYKVVAHRLPPAAAGVSQELPQVSDFSINPNPASGEVTISLDQARAAKIDIFDLLGKRLANFDDNSSHSWNASNQPNGVYIVRASGVDSNDLQFIISKRLVIAR
jgi:hypothetical protein